MSAVLAQPVDERIAQLHTEAAEQLERARWAARQSDPEGAREARGHAADLQRQIHELQQQQPK